MRPGAIGLLALVGCVSEDGGGGGGDRSEALAPICINEVMPDNESTLAVEGETPDWVELHNPTDDPVALDGWRISESRDGGTPLDGRTIPAGGYLVLTADSLAPWADLPFGLSADGEDLQLIGPDGSGRRVEWGYVGPDRSAARTVDCCTDGCWEIAPVGTPGASNTQ